MAGLKTSNIVWATPFSLGATYFVVASDAPSGMVAWASAVQDAGGNVYLCDGTADDVQIQAAVDALPVTGGKVVLSDGNYTLAATVSRAIDDITIMGMGRGTYLANDASTALISAGSQDGWLFEDFETDAGGLTTSSATNWIKKNVTEGATFSAFVTPLFEVTGTYPVVDSQLNIEGATSADLRLTDLSETDPAGRYRIISAPSDGGGVGDCLFFEHATAANWAGVEEFMVFYGSNYTGIEGTANTVSIGKDICGSRSAGTHMVIHPNQRTDEATANNLYIRLLDTTNDAWRNLITFTPNGASPTMDFNSRAISNLVLGGNMTIGAHKVLSANLIFKELNSTAFAIKNSADDDYRDLNVRNLYPSNNIANLISITGMTGYHELTEMTAPGAGAANTARIYAHLVNGGKTELCVIFQTGAVQVLATEP